MSSKVDVTGAQEPRIKIEPKYKKTDGKDAAELVSAYGFTLDTWQKKVLNAWLAIGDDDKYLATSAGLFVPRQNGKNALLEARELYGILVRGEKILHTAHEVKTQRQAFLRLESFFTDKERYPELAEEVLTIRHTNGQEAIELKNGGSVRFSARSKNAARGFTVDILVFDEAQELQNEQLEALIPIVSSSPLNNRQLIYTGTPPTPYSNSEAIMRIRDKALKREDTSQAWHEWSVAEIGDIFDRKRWYKTNPALGVRIPEEFVQRESADLSPEGFARERLGYWMPISRTVKPIGAEDFDTCAIDESEITDITGKITYGVKYAPDNSKVVLAGCIKPKGGKPFVEVIDQKATSEGYDWLVDFFTERVSETSFIYIDGYQGALPLVNELSHAIPAKSFKHAGKKEMIQACAMFTEYVERKKLEHSNQEILKKSALTSIRRKIGTDGGFGFAGDDPAPIEACSLALLAGMTSKRNPKRKAKLL